jgi:hypothetical protein
MNSRTRALTMSAVDTAPTTTAGRRTIEGFTVVIVRPLEPGREPC